MISLLYGRREPEPEVMDEVDEVEAYDAAAASAHLEKLDSICATQILGMNAGPGWWLDAGCGPAQIALKVLQQKHCKIVAVDLAFNMLQRGREHAAATGLIDRIFPVQADAASLPFRQGVFELVYSNSLLHHAGDPAAFFREAARVTRDDGKFFLRDLLRPVRWLSGRHIEHFGRNYSGTMKKLFASSVRAAYTLPEVRRILQKTPLRQSRLSREGGCYLAVRNG